jgi:hypothetical protein
MLTQTYLRRKSATLAQMECSRWKSRSTSCITQSFCTAVVASTAQIADQNRTEERPDAPVSTQEMMKAMAATVQEHQNGMCMSMLRDGLCHASGSSVCKFPKGERQQSMASTRTLLRVSTGVDSQVLGWVMALESPSEHCSYPT